LNPYLVILAAEIKFRRYRASPNAPRLDAEYEALITKTIHVASLLYWEPLTGANAQRLFPSEPGEKMDVDEDGTDESEVTRELLMNFRGENNDAGGSTGRPPKEKVGAERPDVDWRSLLSGHGEQILLCIKFHCFHVLSKDLPLDPDDLKLLHEMDIDQGSHLKRVEAWRNSITAK
jgi:hypothetical protein